MGKRKSMTFGARQLFIVLGLVFGALLWAYFPAPDSGEYRFTSDTSTDSEGSAPDVALAESTEEHPQAPSHRRPVHLLQSRNHPPEANAWDILEDLAWLAVAGDAETGKDRIAHNLSLLSQLGDGALIAIGDFLLSPQSRNPDLQELRRALVRVLLNLGLPEVEDIALQLLGNAPAPIEIWQIGRYLEETQPGKYADMIRQLAEGALVAADVTDELPGELFQLLGEVGNEETVALLAEMPLHRDACSSIALALIPDGSGLSLLEQDARLFESDRDTMQGRMAVELLASQAHRHPAAADVLLDLAGKKLIPADLWANVLSIVSGGWVFALEPPSSGLLGTNTIFRPEGDQVFYRVTLNLGEESFADQDQRRHLLEILQPLAPRLSDAH